MYTLSPAMNRQMQAYESRLRLALASLDAARAETEHARQHYADKSAFLDAVERQCRALQDSQELFFAYLVEEFQLPQPAPGARWLPRETKPGEYALFTAVGSPASQPGPQAVPPREPAAAAPAMALHAAPDAISAAALDGPTVRDFRDAEVSGAAV